jgi:DNA-binding CsgD family transcriptional regulator
MEIQVATHVKQGKSTKEIADILCLAPDTINVHRKKIRKKLGIQNKSLNLQTFLTSLSEE